VPEPAKKQTKTDEKISGVRTKAAIAKKDLHEVATDLAAMDNAGRARSRIGDIARRAERLAEEMARLQGEREGWTERFKEFSLRMAEIATTLEVEVNDTLREKMRPSLIALAKCKKEIDSLDEELEAILVENI
jgi:chromosome segregation ATPase